MTADGAPRAHASDPYAPGSGTARTEDHAQAGAHSAATLRRMIADGALAPGDKLSEDSVAGRLGISRNTLREAFSMLAAETLVTRIPHRGVFVTAPTAEDVRDLYAARLVLEPGALLWGTLGEERLGRLRPVVGAALAAVDAGDVAGMAAANQRFHREIVAAADSGTLLVEMDRMLARMRLVFHAMVEDRRFHARYAQLNAEVLAALEAGDRNRAVELLRDCLATARDEVLARLD